MYSPKQGKIEVESFLDSPWCSHSEQNRRKKLHRDSLEGLLSWWGVVLYVIWGVFKCHNALVAKVLSVCFFLFGIDCPCKMS